MRKITKAERLAELERKAAQADIYTLALQLLYTEECNARERCKEEKDGHGRYLFEIYGATRACGGILIIRFKHPGQKDSVTAYYAEEWVSHMRSDPNMPIELRGVADRLRIALNDIHEFEAARSSGAARPTSATKDPQSGQNL